MCYNSKCTFTQFFNINKRVFGRYFGGYLTNEAITLFDQLKKKKKHAESLRFQLV